MRTLHAMLVIGLAACASGAPLSQPGTIDVAAIRREIQHVDVHPIIAMGHVTNDTAVVFTDDGAARRQEVWQREGQAWKLRDSKEVTR